MTCPPLSRRALARVLQSLLTAELKAVRGNASRKNELFLSPSEVWFEDSSFVGHGPHCLGCDSLEAMTLAAATNQMFHLSEANLDIAMFSAQTFGGWLDIIESAWRAGVTRITLRTSGSTGTPKICTHEFSHLRTEIGYLAEKFVTQERIVAFVQAHHIYGFLFTAMLPDQLGLEVVRAERSGLNGLRSGDLIVSFPEQWQFLNRSLAKWPDHVDGVVSTAPCSSELIRSLIEAGLHTMTEIYGSTETSGIGTRTWPEDTYRLMPHWRPATSTDAQTTDLIHSSGMRVQLMDRIKFSEDGCFTIAGRLDGSVQVGGTNVYPVRIAAMLASRPGVADAAVRLMRHEEGTRLKAFIVPSSDVSPEIVSEELQAWIGAHLTAVERPKALTFGSALPTNLNGNALDW